MQTSSEVRCETEVYNHRYEVSADDNACCLLFQVVQEYERAVIFRLGRLLQNGAKGPGRIIYCSHYIRLFLALMTGTGADVAIRKVTRFTIPIFRRC